jgi:hypothetical protein
MKLQRDVFVATKAAIEENAVGLPVQLLATYIGQVGGCVLIWTDKTEMPVNNPFRIHVITEERIDIKQAAKTEVVKEVKGWG